MMIFLVWLHILAAVTWIGGSLFLSLALVPILKDELFVAQRRALFKTVAGRFRKMAWGSIALLVVTGIPMLIHRVDSLLAPSGWPVALQMKLLLVAVLVGMTALHDFWLGPFVGRLMQVAPESRTPAEIMLIRLSPWIARLGLLLALGIVYLAVKMVRM